MTPALNNGNVEEANAKVYLFVVLNDFAKWMGR